MTNQIIKVSKAGGATSRNKAASKFSKASPASSPRNLDWMANKVVVKWPAGWPGSEQALNKSAARFRGPFFALHRSCSRGPTFLVSPEKGWAAT